eukprot:6528805-Pyramimonas_sp.AAC.1
MEASSVVKSLQLLSITLHSSGLWTRRALAHCGMKYVEITSVPEIAVHTPGACWPDARWRTRLNRAIRCL